MKVAIPLAMGQLTAHFGHCQEFAFVNVDAGKIAGMEKIVPPPHEPGVLPKWLAEHGVTHVIAGGMGGRAQALLNESNIEVVTGAPVEDPEVLVNAWLAKTLATGENACGHDENHVCSH